MKRFRRILQSFVPDVLPPGESHDVCEGILKILSRADVLEVIAYAPWSGAESYEKIGLTRCAERGVSVRILVRKPDGALKSDVQSLLNRKLACPSLTVLTTKAVVGGETAFNHRKIIAIRLKERGWIAVTGSSNHTRAGIGGVDPKESRTADHLNDEYNVVIQLSEKDSVLRDLLEEVSGADPADPNLFPLRSSHPELDASTRPASSVKNTPFSFQQEAITKLNQIWDCFNRSEKPKLRQTDDGDSPQGAILSMPTGSGKTFTAVRWVCERLASDEGIKRVLWLAPSVELTWQAQETWNDCKDYHPESVQIVVGGSNAAEDESTGEDDGPMVRILTIQAANGIESMAAWDLIVVDEVHWGSFLKRDSKSSEQGMLERIIESVRNHEKQSRKVFALGLTATPYRTELHQIDDVSDLLCGEDASHEDVVAYVPEVTVDKFELNGRPLRPLVEFTDIDFLAPAMETTGSGLSILLPDSRSIQDLGSDRDMIAKMVKLYGNLEPKPELTLAFAVDSKSAIDIAAKFQEAFEGVQILISGQLYSGKSLRVANASPCRPSGPQKSFTHQDRRKIYDLMRRGDRRIRLLITVQMARMGIDVPKIDALLMAVPTKSPIWYRQMLGRGMRGPAVGGSERLLVVDCFKSKKVQDKAHANLMHYALAKEDSALDDLLQKSWKSFKGILKKLKHVSIDEACEGKRWDSCGIWCSLMPKANKFRVAWTYSPNLSDSIRRKDLRKDHRLVACPCAEEDKEAFMDLVKTKKGFRGANKILDEIFGY